MREELQSRRTVIAGVGAGGLAVVLAGCGGSTEATPQAGATGAPATTDAPSTSAAPGGQLVGTADVPVGGGTILKEQKIVVVQPVAGEYKAFSASCTHKGCAVSSVESGVIVCPCHGSKFSVEDGSVKDGPATKALPEVQIKVDGTSITLA
ncbi:Rieske 2Fe-2S domain-containing protein [Nonomuraea sp. NPDC046570]|uniref:Rieske (2Fe-2S) protein n=1 Tax=Nonomuraea sp. NPDC046570 TaxID=3155255 RepID=UPI0033F5560D